MLLELGLLVRGEDGHLHQGEPIISTGPEVRSLAVGNFHRQMMQRAADSIETVASPQREISGVTVAISPENFAMLKSKIQELRAEILEMAANDTAPTRVMQLNFQLFPLAESKEEA